MTQRKTFTPDYSLHARYRRQSGGGSGLPAVRDTLQEGQQMAHVLQNRVQRCLAQRPAPGAGRVCEHAETQGVGQGE